MGLKRKKHERMRQKGEREKQGGERGRKRGDFENERKKELFIDLILFITKSDKNSN